jgi:putative FmdB family regulatory protein
MPFYDYHCPHCGFAFEARHGFEDRLTDCPDCGQEGLKRDFNVPTIYVREVRTFGQQAELNARKAGSEKLSLMAAEARDRSRRAREAMRSGVIEAAGGQRIEPPAEAEVPWWRSGETGTPRLDRPLDVGKIRDVGKYIQTGATI